MDRANEQGQPKSLSRVIETIRDGHTIQRALTIAARRALLQHKREGRPAVIWRDGQIVWLQPHEIHVSEDDLK